MAEEQIQCGKCGGRMTHTTVLTYPPIECYRCPKCGREMIAYTCGFKHCVNPDCDYDGSDRQ
jgi:hypothetical protein